MTETPEEHQSPPERFGTFHSALVDNDVALYDTAPCGFLTTTPDGVLTTVNQTFLSWTGYERLDLIGRRTFAELLTPGGRIYHETHIGPMLQMQGAVREIAVDVVASSGARLPMLVNAVLDRDPDGSATGVRTVLFDATERREYERELVRARQRAEDSEARAQVLARTLQQTFIPPRPPSVQGLDIAGRYLPAGDGTEVGGDFYDVFEVGEGAWVVVIGDVCGKGAEAAVVTALARYTIRAAAVRSTSGPQILEVVDEVLRRHETDRFCTVAMILLTPAERGWRCAATSAGHPLPMLHRRGEPPTAIGAYGTLLGVLAHIDLHEEEVLLSPGDEVVLFTDGVTEARRARELFGAERLASAIGRQHGSADALVDAIVDDVTAFQGSNRHDDIAIVALRVTS